MCWVESNRTSGCVDAVVALMGTKGIPWWVPFFVAVFGTVSVVGMEAAE